MSAKCSKVRVLVAPRCWANSVSIDVYAWMVAVVSGRISWFVLSLVWLFVGWYPFSAMARVCSMELLCESIQP